MADPFPKIVPAGVQGPAPEPSFTSSGDPALDYLSGLWHSASSGMTELVGITDPEAEKFRQDHPLAGFVSQWGSALIPYTAWFKATKLIRPLDRAIMSIGNLEKAPFLTGAAREAARLAPFEAIRVGANELVGTEPLPDMMTSAALDLGLTAGIGGLVHGIAASGPKGKKLNLPGVEITAPAPLQLRKIKELITAGTIPPENLPAAQQRIAALELVSRNEQAVQNKYVFGVGTPALDRQLNSLFTVKDTAASLDKRRFIMADKNGFSNEAEWKATARASGLPENFSELGRYYRHVSFRPTGRTEAVAKKVTDLWNDQRLGKLTPEDFSKLTERLANEDYATKRAVVVDRSLTRGLDSVGDNWFLGKEKEGLFVLAKKTKGTPGLGTVDDAWIVLKTDNPSHFLPSNSKWANNVLEKNAWNFNAKTLSDGGLVYNVPRDFDQKFPVQNAEVLHLPGRLSKLIPRNLKGKSLEFSQRLAEGAREYLAPTVAQLRKSPLGANILNIARLTYDNADTMAHEIVYGKQAVSDKSIFRQALQEGKTEPNTDSGRAILEPFADGSVELEQFQNLVREAVDPARYSEMVAKGELSQEVANQALRLGQLSDMVEMQHQKLSTSLGETPKKAPVGQLGFGRVWEGDTRITLADAGGKIKAVVGGPTRKAALANVKKALVKWPELHQLSDYQISKLEKLDVLPAEVRITLGNANFLHNTHGLRGFKGDLESLTRKELLDSFRDSMTATHRSMAQKTVEDLLAQKRAILAAHDAASYRIVESRINDISGIQSDASRWQNKVADKLLAPMLGPNSASKIVSVLNTGIYTFQLGMGLLSHPVVNAVTFIQTVLPEVAMVMGATDRDLGEFYTHFAAGGTKGVVGGGAILSPMKVLIASMKEMYRPRAEFQNFFRRGASEGVTAPRLAEEFVGENATKVSDLRSAFSSGKGFAQWSVALSNFLPANSEKLSRAHAFTVGYIVARDILKIADEEAAYRFTKQFTEKTMYLYSAADRPRIFTAPAGSAMGLFKTWMMNYMASMLEYSGQAVKGNWAPLAWQTAGTAAVGGLAATPLYWVADGFSRAFAGGSLLQTTYDNMNETAADAFMFGMPAALTGISFYSQVNSPLSNPQRDASMLWSMAVLNRITALSKGAGLAFDNWQATGEHPGASAAVRDQMFRALAPATLARVVSAFSGEDMIRSLSTGYPMIDQVSIGDRVGYALGFNPKELDKARQVASELYADRAKANHQLMILGRAFYEAQENKDTPGMNNVLRQATVWGIDIGRVIKSATRREFLSSQPQMEATFKPAKLEKF